MSEACELPLLVGSGITAENLAEYHPLAEAFIVGSSLKEEGRWNAPPDRRRVGEMLDAFARLE